MIFVTIIVIIVGATIAIALGAGLVKAIIIGVVVVVIIDVGITIYYIIVKPPCTLMTRLLFKDRCVGPCPTAATTCVAAAVKPYGPFGLFGLQDAGCACLPARLPSGGLSGAPGGTGGPEVFLIDQFGADAIEKANAAAKLEEERQQKLKEAIDAAGGATGE